MQASDYEGIAKRGAAARQAGQSFYDNPFLFSSVPVDTPEQWSAWTALCNAWSSGWLKEDSGRDQHVARMMWRKYW